MHFSVDMAPNHHFMLNALPLEPVSRTYQYRKIMKPMLERKRRARINKCLDELKELMTGTLQADGENVSKLEKADILELTVRHLHRLRENNALFLRSNETLSMEKFWAGFQHCAAEVSQFLCKYDRHISGDLIKYIASYIPNMAAAAAAVATASSNAAVQAQQSTAVMAAAAAAAAVAASSSTTTATATATSTGRATATPSTSSTSASSSSAVSEAGSPMVTTTIMSMATAVEAASSSPAPGAAAAAETGAAAGAAPAAFAGATMELAAVAHCQRFALAVSPRQLPTATYEPSGGAAADATALHAGVLGMGLAAGGVGVGLRFASNYRLHPYARDLEVWRPW